MTDPVRLNCDTCEVRGIACDDCVVTVLLGPPGVFEVEPAVPVTLARRSIPPQGSAVAPGSTRYGPAMPAPFARPTSMAEAHEPSVLLDRDTVLDEEDRRALTVFADAGLVPPLRFTERHDEPAVEWPRGA